MCLDWVWVGLDCAWVCLDCVRVCLHFGGCVGTVFGMRLYVFCTLNTPEHNTNAVSQSVSQFGGSLRAGLRLAASVGALPQVESERRRGPGRRTITTGVPNTPKHCV